jgi:hypothetical protein
MKLVLVLFKFSSMDLETINNHISGVFNLEFKV